MEISKKDIQCTEIVKKVERMTSQVRKFIRLVNRQLPKELKLNKEHFILTREDTHSYLDDGYTACAGFAYEIIWAYTPFQVETNRCAIEERKQCGAVTFAFQCEERCYDHQKDGLDFFFLYYKGRKKEQDEIAERIDYINDKFNENHLFRPYDLMQVVWRIKEEFYLSPSHISENPVTFQKFAKTFEKEEVRLRKQEERYSKFDERQQLPEEIEKKMEKFKEQTRRFATIVNCYCAVASQKVSKDDMSFFWKAHGGGWEKSLIEGIEHFIKSKTITLHDTYKFLPKEFVIEKSFWSTFTPSEASTSFRFFDCLKCTIGYSYFNKYVWEEGIWKNYHPRLLYFNYYVSRDFQEEHYTISLTSCEGCFRENYMTLIEANTLEELLSSQNAIKIAKWMEEIWRKTALLYEYASIIEKEKIKNFSSNCEIDR